MKNIFFTWRLRVLIPIMLSITPNIIEVQALIIFHSMNTSASFSAGYSNNSSAKSLLINGTANVYSNIFIGLVSSYSRINVVDNSNTFKVNHNQDIEFANFYENIAVGSSVNTTETITLNSLLSSFADINFIGNNLNQFETYQLVESNAAINDIGKLVIKSSVNSFFNNIHLLPRIVMA